MNNLIKVLMIGDGNHYFNRKLVEKLKQYSTDLTIDFFSFYAVNNDSLAYDRVIVCDSQQIEIPYLFKMPGLKGFYVNYYLSNQLKKHLSSNSYTHLHIQSAHPSLGFLNKYLNKCGYIILTIWGSEFYRSSKLNSYFLHKLYKVSNVITFASSDLKNNFFNRYKLRKESKIVRFGLDLLDKIDEQLKTNNHKTNDTINITVGYNRHIAQQHFKVIEQLIKLDNQIKKKIHLIFPFTYGPINDEYRTFIEGILKDNSFSYEFIDEFLPEKDLAILRIRSDIMFQVQTTDQFSGSMQEHLYAGNIVITGNWLNYSDMVAEGISLITLNDFTEIPFLISKILDPAFDKSFFRENKKGIQSLSSWKSNINKWYSLYDSN